MAANAPVAEWSYSFPTIKLRSGHNFKKKNGGNTAWGFLKCRIAQRERESWINQLSWHEILSRRVLSFLDLMKSISKTNNTQRSRVASAIDLFPGRVRPRPSCLPERGPPENVEYFPYSTSPRLKKCNIVEDAATFSHRDGPPPLPRYLDRPASFNMQKKISSQGLGRVMEC